MSAPPFQEILKAILDVKKNKAKTHYYIYKFYFRSDSNKKLKHAVHLLI